MKLVFESPSERNRIEAIVRDASSVSNSQSLIALVKDSMIEGEDPIIKEKTPAEATEPMQEPMADLIARAEEMGIRGAHDMSRAGILLAIEERTTLVASAPKAPKSTERSIEEIIEEADELGIDTEGMERHEILDAIKESKEQ